MNSITLECLLSELAQRGGVIAKGMHTPSDNACCALELAAVCRRIDRTDTPSSVGLPDIRAINDAYRSDGRRTDAMLRWLVALDGWADWSMERKVAWARKVALRTIRQILPIALRAAGLGAHAKDCESSRDLTEAHAAAAAAASAAASAAYDADDAYSAAYSAYSAARTSAAHADAAAADYSAAAAAYSAAASAAASVRTSAARADADDMLDLAVLIQIEAAK